MTIRKPHDADVKPQIERFREMAQELGCDEDEAAFREALGRIARHKPKDEPPSKDGAS